MPVFDPMPVSRAAGSENILSLHTYENEQTAFVVDQYGGFVSQFELFFDLINDLVIGANYVPKKDWPPHRSIQFLLVANNIRFLYSSFEALVKTYWVESMVLSRPAFETFVRAVYCSCYPKTADAVLSHKPRSDGVRFRLTDFIRGDLALDWITYRLWSAVTHSNSYEVFRDLRAVREQKRQLICMRFSFDKTQFEGALNLLVFVSLAFLRLTITLFATSTNDYLTQSDVQKAKQLADLWQNSMRLHPNQHWPEVMHDVDYVFRIIAASEAKQDWKAIVQERKSSSAPRDGSKGLSKDPT